MEQVHTFGALHRDPGERVISVAYYALLGPDEYNLELLEKHNAVWIDLNALPQLGFDHPDMIRKALELLRAKCSHEPIGFNLLPAMFTLSQLQSLYETILGESLDKRNFRKRVAETDCIEKTEFIDKTGSRRGASLYRFNDRAYMSHPKFKI